MYQCSRKFSLVLVFAFLLITPRPTPRFYGHITYRLDGVKIEIEIDRIANFTFDSISRSLYIEMYAKKLDDVTGAHYRLFIKKLEPHHANSVNVKARTLGPIGLVTHWKIPPPGQYSIHLALVSDPGSNKVFHSIEFDAIRSFPKY